MTEYSEVQVRCCAWCDTAFSPSRKDQVYCSRQCKGNARRARKAREDRINQARESIPFTTLEEFDNAPGIDTAGTSQDTPGTFKDQASLDELMALPLDAFKGSYDDGGYLPEDEDDDDGVINGGYLPNTTPGTSDAFADAVALEEAIQAVRAEYDALLAPFRAQLRRNPGVKPAVMVELENERDAELERLVRADARARDLALAAARQGHATATAIDRRDARDALAAFGRDLPGSGRRATPGQGWHGRATGDVFRF